MIESAQEAMRLYCAYPTDDARERTRHDSPCESRSDDKSMNIETINDSSNSTAKIEARSYIPLKEEDNEKEINKWEGTCKIDVIARLMLLNCNDKVIRENDKAIRSGNGRCLADQRYPTTIPEAKSLLIATTSNRKRYNNNNNNNNKTYKKENQNNHDDGNRSNIDYDNSNNNPKKTKR